MSDPKKKPISFEEALAAEDAPAQAPAAPISFEAALAAEPPPAPAPVAPQRTIWERFKDTLPSVPEELSGENLAKHAPSFLGESAADLYAGAQRGFRAGEAKPGQAEIAMGVARPEAETRARWEQASERSPIASGIGDIAGSIANPVGRLPLGGAASGALRASNEGASGEETAKAALAGGAFDIAGKALPAVTRWAGNRLAQGADKVADTLRLRSFGARLGDLKNLNAAKKAELARAGEAYGIHRGEGLLPATTEGVEANANALQQRAGQAKDQIAAGLADAPVSNPALAERVRGLKEGHGRGPGGAPLRAQLDAEATGFENMPREAMDGAQGPVRPSTSFSDMNLERQDYGKATNFTPGTPRAALRPQVYGAINDEMESAANAADPGAGSAWRDANKTESYGIKFGDWANKENTRGDVNRLISPSDYAAGGVGAMLTGAGSVQKGYQEEGLPGALKGAAAAIPGAIAGVALNKGIRGREHALAAGTMRNMAGAGRAGEALAQFGSGAAKASAGAFGQQVGKEVAPPPPSPTDNITAALETDPSALGTWGPRFADAKGDKARMAATYHEAMQDPNFAQQIAPNLQGAR